MSPSPAFPSRGFGPPARCSARLWRSSSSLAPVPQVNLTRRYLGAGGSGNLGYHLSAANIVQLSPKSCIISSFIQTEQGDRMRKNFLRGIYLSVVTAGTLALASDHLTVPTVAPEITKMDVWVGTWESKTQVMTTPYSEAASVTSEMTCTWSPHHGFILCDHLMNNP